MAVSRNLEGKVSVIDDVLSSHEQQIYRAALLDENCVEFEFQTDRKNYADLRHWLWNLKA